MYTKTKDIPAKQEISPVDILSKITDAMQVVLSETADAIARKTGFIKNKENLVVVTSPKHWYSDGLIILIPPLKN